MQLDGTVKERVFNIGRVIAYKNCSQWIKEGDIPRYGYGSGSYFLSQGKSSILIQNCYDYTTIKLMKQRDTSFLVSFSRSEVPCRRQVGVTNFVAIPTGILGLKSQMQSVALAHIVVNF